MTVSNRKWRNFHSWIVFFSLNSETWSSLNDFFSFNKTTLTSVRGGLSKDKKLTLVKVFSVRVVFEVSLFQLFGQRKSNLLTFSFIIHILKGKFTQNGILRGPIANGNCYFWWKSVINGLEERNRSCLVEMTWNAQCVFWSKLIFSSKLTKNHLKCTNCLSKEPKFDITLTYFQLRSNRMDQFPMNFDQK